MTQSAETQFALIAQWKKVMEDELQETKDEVAALRKERDNALKWGIATLGSAVMGMAYWIFTQITGGHFK